MDTVFPASTHNHTQLSRRHFLKTTALMGTALVVEFTLPGCASQSRLSTPVTDWEADAWLSIDQNGSVTFVLDRVEMGQGTMTGLTTLIGEELDIAPSTINVVSARADRAYANPAFDVQITGGSTSMRIAYEPLRRSAAALRQALVNAAATRWQVSTHRISTADGIAHFEENSLPYGQLLHDAALIGLPNDDEITLKTPAQFRYIGKPGPRLDALMKSLGTGTYGIDVQRPTLFKAALKRCPVPGGKLKGWKDTGATKRPGIRKVVAIDTGVAVIADNWWQASQALALIDIEWDSGDLATLSTAQIFADFANAATTQRGKRARLEGDGEDALDDASVTLEAEYRAPYLAHATLEPMNCTVELSSDYCEIWAPTQGPDIIAAWAENITGLARRRIAVHTTLIGGGFGRRLTQDFAIEAIKIAKAGGLPIQLIWSRQDDLQHDVYRPAALTRIKAGLNTQGQLTVWSQKIVTPSIMASALPHMASAVLPAAAPDWVGSAVGSLGPVLYGDIVADPSCTEGAADTLYQIPHIEVRHVTHDPGVPVGYWRSVGHSFNAFFVEAFMDEVAEQAGKDPLEFRLALLGNQHRLFTVLRTLAEKGQWGKPTEGHYQGIAVHASFASFVGQIAEVSVDKGVIRVHKVTCVVDCGRVINPDIVVAQMEGGINFGLSAALLGEITHIDGVVQQRNFDDYALMRMDESPRIDVHIIPSDAPPSGVGEPGVPPIAPAVANAVYAATGKRLRQLPLRLKV